MQGVPQCFDGDIFTNMATMLETIGHRLGHAVDGNIDALHSYALDACGQDLTGRTDDLEPKALQVRCSGFMRDCHPDRVWQLGRQLVVPKGANQTDNAVRNKPDGFRKIMGNILADTFWILIEATAEAHQITGLSQSFQIDQGYACRLEVTRTRNAPSSSQLEGALAIIRMTFGHDVIYCRQYLFLVDI